MKLEQPEYEFPIEDRQHARRAGQPAGIYLLDGRYHIAAHWTAQERALVARGALYVATLLFDACPYDTGRDARPLRLAPFPAPPYTRAHGGSSASTRS